MDGREWLFTVFVTSASRCFWMRDSLMRVARRLRKPATSQRFYFPSGGRRLEGVLVEAEQGLPTVLICHGIGETVDVWSEVQAFLCERGIGSMVFDYSGFGKSSGTVSASHLDQDLASAYLELRRRVGEETCVFLLGFSLGTGIAASCASSLTPPIAGLFLCEAYTCFHEAVRATGLPEWLVKLSPDIWRTIENVREVNCRVCVVHSDADRLFPVEMGLSIARACGGEFIKVSGYDHDALYLRPDAGYWAGIVERMLP